MESDRPPSLSGVLETVLYFRDQDRAERFYVDVMGMRLLDREPGRSLFFRAGDSVFLLFDPDEARRGGRLPAHGANGPGHTCFRVDPDRYEPWKAHLRAHGIAIVHEEKWTRGSSFYFTDGEGNLLEIADGDLWPL